MPINNFEAHVTEHLIAGIDACLEGRHHSSALVLIYSTMDVMAWLNRAEAHPDVERSDFLRWVDNYLLPKSNLPCNSMDLYGARCAILHSFSAESKLSRQGKARPLVYSWGNNDEAQLQNKMDLLTEKPLALHMTKLRNALVIGIERFSPVVERSSLMKKRTQKFFSNMRQFPQRA